MLAPILDAVPPVLLHASHRPHSVDSSERLGCRWMVEHTWAWLNRFRRLTIRYGRREDIHLAFIHPRMGSHLPQSMRTVTFEALSRCVGRVFHTYQDVCAGLRFRYFDIDTQQPRYQS